MRDLTLDEVPQQFIGVGVGLGIGIEKCGMGFGYEIVTMLTKLEQRVALAKPSADDTEVVPPLEDPPPCNHLEGEAVPSRCLTRGLQEPQRGYAGV